MVGVLNGQANGFQNTGQRRNFTWKELRICYCYGDCIRIHGWSLLVVARRAVVIEEASLVQEDDYRLGYWKVVNLIALC